MYRCLLRIQAMCNDTILDIIIDTGVMLNFIYPRFQLLLYITRVRPIAVKSIHSKRRLIDREEPLLLEIGGYLYVFNFFVIP